VFSRGGSFQLARVFGIRIGVTPTWFIVLFAFIYLLTGQFGDVVEGSDTQAFVLAVVASLLFFGSIILHELGHAIVARRNGIGIAGIDLFFFGGIAKLTKDAETPGAEFRVAAAGPAVTGLIVLLCLGGAALANHAGDVVDSARFTDTQVTAVEALVGWLGVINLYLLVLNIIPALPLDGGRIARAIAWRITGDRARGTRVAARAGQGFAYLMMAAGLFFLVRSDAITGIWLLILGVFINQAAKGELVASAFSQRIEGIRVADVMDAEPVTIPADVDALRAQDEWFLRYRYPWFPVVTAEGRFAGVLHAERVDAAVAGGQPALPVSELLDEASTAYHVGRDRPLRALLNEPGLRELGALAAIDAEGVLVGVVTLDQVRRALVEAAPGRTSV